MAESQTAWYSGLWEVRSGLGRLNITADGKKGSIGADAVVPGKICGDVFDGNERKSSLLKDLIQG